jgi:hypothetical protein
MTPVASSGIALSDLRFGEFTGDGITDVIAIVSGRWQMSRGARGPWEPLNTLSDSLENVVIANVDGAGSDDIIALGATRICEGTNLCVKWRISREGRGAWQNLDETYVGRPYVGKFSGSSTPDLMVIQIDQIGQGLRKPFAVPGEFVRFGRYPF